MKLSIFKKKQPTVQDVETEIQKLSDKRQGLLSEQNTIEQELIKAYGTDTDTEPLNQRAYAIELELKILAGVSSELSNALIEATQNSYISQYEAMCKAISDDVQKINDNKPSLEKLYHKYNEALQADRQTRQAIKASKGKLAHFYNSLSVEDHAAKGAEFQAIREKYPLIDHDIANDFHAAKAIKKQFQGWHDEK